VEVTRAKVTGTKPVKGPEGFAETPTSFFVPKLYTVVDNGTDHPIRRWGLIQLRDGGLIQVDEPYVHPMRDMLAARGVPIKSVP
jgi:hypothetical protein